MLGDSDSLMKMPNAESFIMRYVNYTPGRGRGSPFHSSVRTELGQDLNRNLWIKVYQLEIYELRFINMYTNEKVSVHENVSFNVLS